ncbi:MAG: hypothetical protein LBP95_05115 [Deltaproteobacteria bacterium]|nr:hypothetical protein [Deltaproteobacteria bacterium]
MATDVLTIMRLQAGLEAVLVILLAVLLWRSARRRTPDPAAVPDNLKNSIERFLAESEKIAAAFQVNLEDKKNLTADLILKLDRRLADYRELLEQTGRAAADAERRILRLGDELGEQVRLQAAQAQAQAQAAGEGRANPAAPEVRSMVLQLAKKGLSVEDIAVRSRLHRGEVELIIDLENQFSV